MANLITDTSVSVAIANPLWRRQKIPAGSTYAAGQTVVAGFLYDSNEGRLVISVPLTILHNLADPIVETTYRTGSMITDMTVLMAPSWWQVAGVSEVIGVPELDPPERIGNVIEYTITAQLALLP